MATIELKSRYLSAYGGKEGLDYAEIERVYPVSSVLDIDPGESEIKGAPPTGDGTLFMSE